MQTPTQKTQLKRKATLVRLSQKRDVITRVNVELDSETTTWLDVKLLLVTRGYIKEIEKNVQENETVDDGLIKILIHVIQRWGFIDTKEAIVEALLQYKEDIDKDLGEGWESELQPVTEKEYKDEFGEDPTEEFFYIPVCASALKGMFPSMGDLDYFDKLFSAIQSVTKNPTTAAGETK